MFDVNNIIYNPNTKQYTCSCQCSSPSNAEELLVRGIALSRIVPAGEMFVRGSAVIIGAGAEDDVRKVASIVNARFFR